MVLSCTRKCITPQMLHKFCSVSVSTDAEFLRFEVYLYELFDCGFHNGMNGVPMFVMYSTTLGCLGNTASCLASNSLTTAELSIEVPLSRFRMKHLCLLAFWAFFRCLLC